MAIPSKKTLTRLEYLEHRSTHTGLGEILRLLEAEGHKESELVNNFQLIKEALGLIPSITTDIDSQFTPQFQEAIEKLNKMLYQYAVELKELKSKTSSVEQKYRHEYEEKIKDIPRRERTLDEKYYKLLNKEIDLTKKEEELKKREAELDFKERKVFEMETPESRDMVRRLELFLRNVSKTEKTERAIAYGVGAILSGKPVDFEKGTNK